MILSKQEEKQEGNSYRKSIMNFKKNIFKVNGRIT